MNKEYIKELWALVRENTKGIRELRESQKKTDEQIKELKESQKKTDEQLKKTDEQLKRIENHIKQTDEHIKQTEEQLKRMIGEFTDGWGKFVEGLVEPSVRKVFKREGIDVRETFQRAAANMNGRELEIDILGIGEDRLGKRVILITEAKSNLTQRDIDKAIERFKEFTEFFPEYRGNRVIGVVAGIRITRRAKEYAISNGLYVLVPSGEIMEIENPKGFKPKQWG